VDDSAILLSLKNQQAEQKILEIQRLFFQARPKIGSKNGLMSDGRLHFLSGNFLQQNLCFSFCIFTHCSFTNQPFSN
jgi:hypothetical protein